MEGRREDGAQVLAGGLPGLPQMETGEAVGEPELLDFLCPRATPCRGSEGARVTSRGFITVLQAASTTYFVEPLQIENVLQSRKKMPLKVLN